ncbi:MAG TPA: CPBP family intramembrane glutamic endopeptidase [Thermoanaerobaculia bacterium]|nr:CPBP family intramembrane glutamic endopeptidase [Thermoanaerobaculia bacterium]
MSRFTFWRPVYLFALLSAALATVVANAVVDRGKWHIGFFVAPRLAAKELLLGIGFAALLIAGIDLCILLLSDLRHVRAGGFPWRELWIVFIPAAVQEELVFRGYVFQRVRAWNRGIAIAGSSLVFGFLHAGNSGSTPVAIASIVVAGVMLALAYERYERLWFPIGLHLAWNVLSGPILGYDVSGYIPSHEVFRTIGGGNVLVTGGTFGIEGSVVSVVIEAFAVALLIRLNRMRPERSIR